MGESNLYLRRITLGATCKCRVYVSIHGDEKLMSLHNDTARTKIRLPSRFLFIKAWVCVLPCPRQVMPKGVFNKNPHRTWGYS